MVTVRGPPTLIGGPPLVQQAAGDLRAGLRRAARVLPRAERGLLPGLVLGDTSRMPAGLVDDFRTAGLTHLTAVSGANLAIVVTFVLVVGRWAGLRGRWLPVTAALAMAWFVVLARPQPSVLRAAVMGAIALLALGTGRRRRSLAALAAAVLGLLLIDPWLARSFGFALSVLATAGLVLLAPGWARAWTARGLPRPVAEALAVPVAAQLVCAPVIVLLSGQVSLVAVAANLLAAPGGRARDGSRGARDRHRTAERRRGRRAGGGGRRTGRLARAGRAPVPPRCPGPRSTGPGRWPARRSWQASSSSRSLPHGC